MTNGIPWLLSVSESKKNYWMTYITDFSMMAYFLAWDVTKMHASFGTIAGLYVLGAFSWTLSEYAFHRWVYHLGFRVTREGHEKHHEDPTAYIAMPFFITPLLFLPPQLIVSWWFGVHGFSAYLSGWFAGFIGYSFMHHSLHHYKVKFAWFRHLQSEHRIHHALPETNFGVTMRFWDKVFGTEFTKQQKP
jgi:sterol desaturase/sphingolipid hydroxylase (fatty acid hydroxylase superfamily)